jgi:membrane-associated phospholipid phosphatase
MRKLLSLKGSCGRGLFRPRDVPVGVLRRTMDRTAALTGAVIYSALAYVAAGGPDKWERGSFREVNHTGGLMPVLRVPEQLGTPWVLPLTGAAAFHTHRPHLAVSATLALPTEKGLEVVVKQLTQRGRPAQTMARPRLRADAPASGSSFPSGHAAVAGTLATLAAPYLQPLALTAAMLAALATAATRLYQGAHYPLDVVGGAALGLTTGSLLNWFIGLPVSGEGQTKC